MCRCLRKILLEVLQGPDMLREVQRNFTVVLYNIRQTDRFKGLCYLKHEVFPKGKP